MARRVSWQELFTPSIWKEFVKDIGSGQLCAVPTDTLFGFLVDGNHQGGVDRLYELKGRIKKKPLILLVGEIEALNELAIWPFSQKEPSVEGQRIREIMHMAWPGPLTIVLSAPSEHLSTFTFPGLGVRIPDHGRLRALLRQYPGYVLSTSVNRSGQAPLTTAEAIEDEFGAEIEWIVQQERPMGTMASTVIDGRKWPPVVLRNGAWKPSW